MDARFKKKTKKAKVWIFQPARVEEKRKKEMEISIIRALGLEN